MRTIRECGADYVISLKGNQGHLHAEVENYFTQAVKVSPEESGCDYAVTEETSRERHEKREAWMASDLDWLPQKQDWVGLESAICIRSTRTVHGKTTTECRFFISSLPINAAHAMAAARKHWYVENSLHWQLDVSYSEDRARVKKDNGPENLSILRRSTLNLLKADTATKAGIKNKRAKAGWDKRYMLSLLEGR